MTTQQVFPTEAAAQLEREWEAMAERISLGPTSASQPVPLGWAIIPVHDQRRWFAAWLLGLVVKDEQVPI